MHLPGLHFNAIVDQGVKVKDLVSTDIELEPP